MGQPPTLVIRGMWDYYGGRHEWDQYDWESKIFPRYKVDRTTWPKELIEVRPTMYLVGETTDGFIRMGPIVLLIWVLDDDSIGALSANGDGHYPDEFARTLPRSALPNAK